jgi:hypothetical protein
MVRMDRSTLHTRYQHRAPREREREREREKYLILRSNTRDTNKHDDTGDNTIEGRGSMMDDEGE